LIANEQPNSYRDRYQAQAGKAWRASDLPALAA
jgi:hypothetical protein